MWGIRALASVFSAASLGHCNDQESGTPHRSSKFVLWPSCLLCLVSHGALLGWLWFPQL